MANVHSVLAWAAVGGAGLVLVVGLGTAVGALSSIMVVDRAILVHLASVTIAAISGLVLPVTGPGPSDPLHLLYGAVAVVPVPLARYHARHRSVAAVGRWTLAAAIVTVGVLLRLFMTGR